MQAKIVIMKLLNLLFLLIFLLIGCKPSDLKISAPTASKIGSSKVNFDHNMFLTAQCSQCHESKRPITIPAHGNGNDCISCHTASPNSSGVRTWLNLTNFNHTPTPTSCVSCHENKRPILLAPHMASQWGEKQDCVSCHTYPSWKPAKFDHIKPLTSCIECHRTTTKDDRPLPKTSHPSSFYNQIDCVSCHTNSTNTKKWTDLTFNHRTHTPAPTSCMSCHEIKRPLSHTVSPKISGMDKADCKSCHTSTTNWAQSVAFDHETSAPSTCVGCHSSSIPTGQTGHPSVIGNYSKIDCSRCHTYDQSTSPRSWTKITFNHLTHNPAKSSCIECHKTINNSFPTSGTHLTGSRNSKDCATCHTFNSIKLWTDFSKFNHIAIETNERCDTCHTSSIKTLTAKTSTHIPTSLDCKSCHTSTAWKPATFTHSTADTNCSSCHNGTSALGKTTNHIPTSTQCSSCHSTTAFKPTIARTHSVENLTNCSTCHSGTTTATGKTMSHVTTTSQCSTCHLNTAWKPATYTHATTDTNCTSCHNGTTAIGKTTTHVTTTAQCSTCHTNTAWKPATYTHATTDTNCTSCHNGTTATGKPTTGTAKHTLTAQCSTCHSQTSWTTLAYKTTYKHSSSGRLPPKGTSYHKVQSSCATCHSSTTDGVVYTNTATNSTYSSCLGCHTNKFLDKHSSTEYASKGNCLSCHSYSSW